MSRTKYDDLTELKNSTTTESLTESLEATLKEPLLSSYRERLDLAWVLKGVASEKVKILKSLGEKVKSGICDAYQDRLDKKNPIDLTSLSLWQLVSFSGQSPNILKGQMVKSELLGLGLSADKMKELESLGDDVIKGVYLSYWHMQKVLELSVDLASMELWQLLFFSGQTNAMDYAIEKLNVKYPISRYKEGVAELEVVGTCGEDGRNPIHWVVMSGNLAALKRLENLKTNVKFDKDDIRVINFIGNYASCADKEGRRPGDYVDYSDLKMSEYVKVMTVKSDDGVSFALMKYRDKHFSTQNVLINLKETFSKPVPRLSVVNISFMKQKAVGHEKMSESDALISTASQC